MSEERDKRGWFKIGWKELGVIGCKTNHFGATGWFKRVVTFCTSNIRIEAGIN